MTCVPLVPFKAAAGAFSDPQHVDDDDFEWVQVDTRHRLRKGMFVAKVIGKSMEPGILDGSYCLFSAPVEGSRQGKTVLALVRDEHDPETGERFTVKRYESRKVRSGDSWSHEEITLTATNPAYPAIVVSADESEGVTVIAELVAVLHQPAAPN